MRRPGSRRPGFTLIELLVVIAIIAVLIGLLLPAIQKVREAAARAQCINNMKQQGVAMHNYHGANNHFPPGSVGVSSGGVWYGHSFWVFLLPYMEQNAIFQQFDLTGTSSGTTYPSTGWLASGVAAGNFHNGTLLNNVSISILICPSSTMPTFATLGTNNILNADYTGISGSSVDPGTIYWNGAYYYPGYISSHGVLIAKTPVSVLQITDGTTNTMMIAEQSDWCVNASGVKADCRSSCGSGFTMGICNEFPSTEDRPFNLTTVRYAMSKDSTLANSGGNCGANSPIQSAHTGGANILLSDGSVQFLSSSTTVTIMQQLATRDDGTAFLTPPF